MKLVNEKCSVSTYNEGRVIFIEHFKEETVFIYSSKKGATKMFVNKREMLELPTPASLTVEQLVQFLEQELN